MPIYTFTCTCGNTFDVQKPAREMDYPQPCPNCDETAKRLFTRPILNVPMKDNNQRFVGKRYPK